MADTKQSFQELLDAAPLAEDEPLQLTGWLSRSGQADHFVLGLADGTSITLPVSAVKQHTVIAGSAGRAIVNLSVDRSAVPAEALATVTASIGDGRYTVSHTARGGYDMLDHPTGSGYTGAFLDPLPIGGDIPFGLATAHQSAAAASIAAQGAAPAITRNKWLQDGWKQPEADLTTPPHLDI